MGTEGGSTWLAIAALIGAIVLYTAWLVLANASPGRIPGSLNEVAVRGFEGGQHAVFAPSKVHVGDVFDCTNSGLRVAVHVPARGHLARVHLVPPALNGGVTIVVRTSEDGTVRVSCSA